MSFIPLSWELFLLMTEANGDLLKKTRWFINLKEQWRLAFWGKKETWQLHVLESKNYQRVVLRYHKTIYPWLPSSTQSPSTELLMSLTWLQIPFSGHWRGSMWTDHTQKILNRIENGLFPKSEPQVLLSMGGNGEKWKASESLESWEASSEAFQFIPCHFQP